MLLGAGPAELEGAGLTVVFDTGAMTVDPPPFDGPGVRLSAAAKTAATMAAPNTAHPNAPERPQSARAPASIMITKNHPNPHAPKQGTAPNSTSPTAAASNRT